MQTGSALIISLLVMMSAFGHVRADTAVEESFSILLLEIGQPGSCELSFVDSLMPLIEARMSGFDGVEVVRLNDPLPSEEEFETLINNGELDVDAAACMMLQIEDTTALISCSYMSVSEAAVEEDRICSDQACINIEEWPLDPEAVEDFTEALSISGTDPEIYYHRALCRERTGDISGAREDL